LKQHNELVRALGQEADRQGLTEEQLFEELEKDKKLAFEKFYGNQPD
jgi:hypothetical protein